MARPLISVVMPVRNGERFLAASIDSIRAQSVGDFDLIVIDDGSTDRTADILASYAIVDSRIRVHRQEPSGLVSALNAGSGLARAAYIARMDADDIASPVRFERQISFLESEPRVDVLGSAIVVIDETDRPLFPVRYALTDAAIRRTLAMGTAFAHPSVMLRRDALLAVGGYRRPFDEYATDYDLWLRLSERCTLANLRDVLVRYRYHPGSVTAHNMPQQVLALVAADASARIRRSGQRDTVPDLPSVSVESLLDLGIPRRLVFTRILELSAARCGFLLRVGRADEAFALLDWAQEVAGAQASAAARSRAGVMRAIGHYHQRAIRNSLNAALGAVSDDPLTFARLGVTGLSTVARDRVRGRPSCRLRRASSPRGRGSRT
jgi:glycosyltransferase involved in cell wall biosynthesis